MDKEKLQKNFEWGKNYGKSDARTFMRRFYKNTNVSLEPNSPKKKALMGRKQPQEKQQRMDRKEQIKQNVKLQY